jgi:fatty-acyl-CoA synthase
MTNGVATKSFDWIAHHARTRPDKLASVDLGTGRRFSYAEMDDRCGRLATALAEIHGIGFGDRVAVLANNNTNFFEVQFACWKLGAIFTPLNWRLALPELEFILGDSRPSLLIVDDTFVELGENLLELGLVPAIINWQVEQHYEEALANAAPLAVAVDCTHDTPLTIMYTSGTTGRPKGAIITHGMLFFNAVNCVEFFGVGTDMVNLVFLPLFHIAGLNTFANPAYHFGGTNIVMPDFDPGACLKLLGDEVTGVTHFLGVPTNYLFMSQHPDFETAKFPTVKSAALGGAPSPLPLLEAWGAKGLPLQQAFGMTETAPLVTALKPEDAMVKVGSAGLPALHTEVRVVDPDGNDIAPGEIGEIWTRGPNVTPGYWEYPEANEASFTDGYLKTGDAARTDDEGYIYIVDRWKDMYISGGENVYPAEVETVIYQLQAIGEVAIIGVPDERWGEVGRAIIVRKPDAELGEAEVLAHCKERLAKFKVPKSAVFVDELPHNATGKVLKRELPLSYGS